VPALTVHIRTVPAPTLVTIVGEIDLLTAPELRAHVLAVPDGDVVLDASGVELLAAAGLRVLLDLQDRRARAGARLVLAAPSPPVWRILAITGCDTTIPMTATVEDAVGLITDRSEGGRPFPGRRPMDGAVISSSDPGARGDHRNAEQRDQSGAEDGAIAPLRRGTRDRPAAIARRDAPASAGGALDLSSAAGAR
jgi:stage II sporulation protein AA (anti-sigma F factor antagonist)